MLAIDADFRTSPSIANRVKSLRQLLTNREHGNAIFRTDSIDITTASRLITRNEMPIDLVCSTLQGRMHHLPNEVRVKTLTHSKSIQGKPPCRELKAWRTETVNGATCSVVPGALAPNLPEPETDDRFFSFPLNYNSIAVKIIPYSALGAGFNILRDDHRVFTLRVLNIEETPTTVGISDLFADGAVILSELRIPVRLFGRNGQHLIGGAWSSKTFMSLGQDGRIDLRVVFDGGTGIDHLLQRTKLVDGASRLILLGANTE